MIASVAHHALVITSICVLVCSAAIAHTGDAGTRVDQETTIEIGESTIAITYVTTFNRQAAFFLELPQMDSNADGRISQREKTSYFAELRDKLRAGLEMRINGNEVPLRQVGEVELSAPSRDCLQKRYRYEAQTPADWRQGTAVEFYNDNYLDCVGSITLQLTSGCDADIIYDPHTFQIASSARNAPIPLDPQERDVVFRFQQGRGRVTSATTGDSANHKLTDRIFACDQPLLASARNRSMHILLLAGGTFLGVCLLLLVLWRSAIPRFRSVASSLCAALVLGLVVTSFAGFAPSDYRDDIPDQTTATRIFRQLHDRIYETFKAESDTEIYEMLAGAMEGDALHDTFMTLYKAAVDDGEDGTQVHIRRIKPLATAVIPESSTKTERPAFRVHYRWRVYGLVTHLNHTHARFNEYAADYLVEHTGTAWRITDSEVHDIRRVALAD